MRLLVELIVVLNMMTLKDKAWYTRDLEQLRRLQGYIETAHTTNINHMSHAGLFKANRGDKEVQGQMLDGCEQDIVRFTMDGETYYALLEDVIGL